MLASETTRGPAPTATWPHCGPCSQRPHCTLGNCHPLALPLTAWKSLLLGTLQSSDHPCWPLPTSTGGRPLPPLVPPLQPHRGVLKGVTTVPALSAGEQTMWAGGGYCPGPALPLHQDLGFANSSGRGGKGPGPGSCWPSGCDPGARSQGHSPWRRGQRGPQGWRAPLHWTPHPAPAAFLRGQAQVRILGQSILPSTCPGPPQFCRQDCPESLCWGWARLGRRCARPRPKVHPAATF